EVEILRGLRHRHIVAFHQMGVRNGLLYFVMDFIAGRDAARIVKESGLLAIPRAVRLTCQLLDALAYAHAQGFVHRDIKPGHLLGGGGVGQEGPPLAGLGLARAYQASQFSGLTITGSAGGTPAYMPPEQVRDFRTVKPPADQYAAAATLYNL